MSGRIKQSILVGLLCSCLASCKEEQAGPHVDWSDNPPIGQVKGQSVVLDDSAVVMAACKRIFSRTNEKLVLNKTEKMTITDYQGDSISLVQMENRQFLAYHAHSANTRLGILFVTNVQDSLLTLERTGTISYFVTGRYCKPAPLNKTSPYRVFYQEPKLTDSTCKYEVNTSISVNSTRSLIEALKSIFS